MYGVTLDLPLAACAPPLVEETQRAFQMLQQVSPGLSAPLCSDNRQPAEGAKTLADRLYRCNSVGE